MGVGGAGRDRGTRHAKKKKKKAGVSEQIFPSTLRRCSRCRRRRRAAAEQIDGVGGRRSSSGSRCGRRCTPAQKIVRRVRRRRGGRRRSSCGRRSRRAAQEVVHAARCRRRGCGGRRRLGRVVGPGVRRSFRSEQVHLARRCRRLLFLRRGCRRRRRGAAAEQIVVEGKSESADLRNLVLRRADTRLRLSLDAPAVLGHFACHHPRDEACVLERDAEPAPVGGILDVEVVLQVVVVHQVARHDVEAHVLRRHPPVVLRQPDRLQEAAQRILRVDVRRSRHVLHEVLHERCALVAFRVRQLLAAADLHVDRRLRRRPFVLADPLQLVLTEESGVVQSLHDDLPVSRILDAEELQGAVVDQPAGQGLELDVAARQELVVLRQLDRREEFAQRRRRVALRLGGRERRARRLQVRALRGLALRDVGARALLGGGVRGQVGCDGCGACVVVVQVEVEVHVVVEDGALVSGTQAARLSAAAAATT
eukprot:Rhum_TRINITY_DN14262_c14_g1::Rhum_TRINITY_DN14262_c14_g1_i1::g.73807::m.73807